MVIAADPRSNYENLPDYFRGRTCIRGKTIDLIRESQLVLAHRSTALSFASLYYKPVIFMTCDYLDKRFDGQQIREMAKCFGKKPLFMENDNHIDWNEELKIDKNYYDRYRQSYIKSKCSTGLPFWQVVADRLKQGF